MDTEPLLFGLPYHSGHHRALIGFLCCTSAYGCLVAQMCPTLCNPTWTVAHLTPKSMGFPRQEYRSGLPFPSPGDLPDPGTEPTSPAWQVDSLPGMHVLYNRISLIIYFIYSFSSVYISVPISQFIPHPPCPLVSKCSFSMSGSLFLLCK